MNFSRAFTRDMRYLRSSFHTSMMARSTGITSSTGTKTPMSLDRRGQVDRPPPIRTANPFLPSRTMPNRLMQLISGALHWWGQQEMVILCLRGRSQ